MAGTIKCLFIGGFNSGKTALLTRLTEDIFEPTSPTIGVEFHQMEIPGLEHRVTVWNLAGAPRFQAILELYYKDSQVIYLVMDSSVQGQHAAKWVSKARRLAPGARIVFVFTKIDLPMHYNFQEMDLMAKHYSAHCAVALSSKEMSCGEVMSILAPTFHGIEPRRTCLSGSSLSEGYRNDVDASLFCCAIQ